MAKFRTLVIVTAAITLMAGCESSPRSPLIGKWKVAAYMQSCGEYSGFEFNNSDYTVLFTNGTHMTGSVTYVQDADGEHFYAIPQGGYNDLGGNHYAEFRFTLDKINNGILFGGSNCELIPDN
jgi:hypothetical protein